ncbi:MAG: hypothetical protein ACR2HG_15960 [Pyrinomonadaceae bacterium]
MIPKSAGLIIRLPILTTPRSPNLIFSNTSADLMAICASRSAPIANSAAVFAPLTTSPAPFVPTTASTTAYSTCPTSLPIDFRLPCFAC